MYSQRRGSLVMGDQLVMTRAVADQVKENREFSEFVTTSVLRFANYDWGESQKDSVELNNSALQAWKSNDEEHMDRVLAVYKSEPLHAEIWIITEWDRCATTILFPSDY